MSAMFLAMVWHARRRALMHKTVEALAGERAGLLEQQERLVQNVSHELRTPVTIARGHLDQLAAASRAARPRDRRRLGRADPDGAPDRPHPAPHEGRARGVARPRPGSARHAGRGCGDALGGRRAAGLARRPRRRRRPVRRRDLAAGCARRAARERSAAHRRVRPDRAVRTRRGRRRRPVRFDGGAGIDAAVLERIFERFARADASRSRREGGVGLGLSIAAAIARAHGGSCSARNAPSGGAVVELRLPLHNAANAEEASEPGPPFVADAPVATPS